MAEPAKHADIIRAARRAQWACGLCFALLFLMGVTGIASITLLYDDPLYQGNLGGIEGTTLETVIAMRGAIEFIHEWGGYLAIVLAGWSAMEVFRFARRVRRSDVGGWRGSARWMGPAGLIGGVVIIAAIVLLLASGVAARGLVDHFDSRHGDDLSAFERGTALTGSEAAEHKDFQLAELHIRELNYALAFGALLIVACAASIRRISNEARKPGA